MCWLRSSACGNYYRVHVMSMTECIWWLWHSAYDYFDRVHMITLTEYLWWLWQSAYDDYDRVHVMTLIECIWWLWQSVCETLTECMWWLWQSACDEYDRVHVMYNFRCTYDSELVHAKIIITLECVWSLARVIRCMSSRWETCGAHDQKWSEVRRIFLLRCKGVIPFSCGALVHAELAWASYHAENAGKLKN